MKPNTINLIVLSLIIAAGAYWYFFSGSGNQAPLTQTASSGATQSEFPVPVGELQSISFDTSIFSDPRYTSLVDITTAVQSEPAGRADPFAVIPGVTGM
ncbi:MAG: hypothetical protein ACHQU0_01840 [Candidatus Paceibacteria bacterium]